MILEKEGNLASSLITKEDGPHSLIETQRNPNEPGKSGDPGQQGVQEGDRERQEPERQQREREKQGGGGQPGGGKQGG